MQPCDTIIWVAFIRPRIPSGMTRWPATQSSEVEIVQATPAKAATTKKRVDYARLPSTRSSRLKQDCSAASSGAIPGLGPFIAAGPIMAALSGGAIGAGVGGLTGSLGRMRHPSGVGRTRRVMFALAGK